MKEVVGSQSGKKAGTGYWKRAGKVRGDTIIMLLKKREVQTC